MTINPTGRRKVFTCITYIEIHFEVLLRQLNITHNTTNINYPRNKTIYIYISEDIHVCLKYQIEVL